MTALKKICSLFLCAVLFFVTMGVSFTAFAVAYPRDGYVNGTEVNMRSGAGTDYDIVTVTSYRQNLSVKGEEKGKDGNIWYSVVLEDGKEGYIRSDFVTLKPLSSYIEFIRTGVTTSKTTMYSAPGDWNERVVSVPIDTVASIYAKDFDTDGDMWYYATVTVSGVEYTGYLFNTRVKITASYEYDENFENHLDEQGFPESYKEKLRIIHAVYPEWVFIADKIDISWSEALALETRTGWNLVQTNYDAWKSMEAGAYNWEEEKYVNLDSGNWVAAHKDVVAYYLDPRNFLTEQNIFQFVGMSFDKDVHTKEALQKALNGTFMEGSFPEAESEYETWADVLFAASESYGMSPYALAGMILLEQGRDGSGKLISGQETGYEGYYNFLNIGAYAGGGNSAVKNGLIYASTGSNYSRPWNTREKAIFGGTEFYVQEYIKRGQDTLYYKKFNVVSKPYASHQYMTNIQAAYSEAANTKKAYDNMSDSALIFNIPVYSGMPETAVAYPTTTGNNNFYLESLTIDGYSLSPTFNFYNNTYELVVDGRVDNITVSAKAKDEKASVSGTGTYNLNVGINEIKITVTSTSGRTNTYTIIAERGEYQEETSFSKEYYKFSQEYIFGVSAQTTVSVLTANLSVKNGSVRVLKSDSSENTGVVCTGDTLEILKSDGSMFATYTVCVNGDVNGDGKISLIDLSKVQRYLLQIDTFTGAAEISADISGDGKISLIDLAKIQRHLLQIENIS